MKKIEECCQIQPEELAQMRASWLEALTDAPAGAVLTNPHGVTPYCLGMHPRAYKEPKAPKGWGPEEVWLIEACGHVTAEYLASHVDPHSVLVTPRGEA